MWPLSLFGSYTLMECCMLEWCDHLLIYLKCCVLIWEPHFCGMVIARSVVSATWDVCAYTSTTPALHLATLWHWLSSLVAPRTLLAAQTQSHWCWASPLALNPHCSQGECWWATAEWALSDLEGSPLAVTLSCPLEISSCVIISSFLYAILRFNVHEFHRSGFIHETIDINGYV